MYASHLKNDVCACAPVPPQEDRAARRPVQFFHEREVGGRELRHGRRWRASTDEGGTYLGFY